MSERNEDCVKPVANESSAMLLESSLRHTDMHLPIASRTGYYFYCHIIWNEKQDAALLNVHIGYSWERNA